MEHSVETILQTLSVNTTTTKQVKNSNKLDFNIHFSYICPIIYFLFF